MTMEMDLKKGTTIKTLIEEHGRERIKAVVEDLKPGGQLEMRTLRYLRENYPLHYAVLGAVGRGDLEAFLGRWVAANEASYCDPNVSCRIHKGYQLPDPPEQPADDGVKIPRELVDLILEAMKHQRDLALRACNAAKALTAESRLEATAWQAVISYIKGNHR